MTEKAFFSYSRSDSAFVLKLAKDLRDAGAELWLDQLDIKAGSHWDSSIEAALNAAPCLIVILSPASVASHNVMDEVSFALEHGKKVIPVMLSECTPPFRLRRLQRIDFTGDYQAGLNHLITALGHDEKPPLTEKNQEAAETENNQVSSKLKDQQLEKLLWQKAKAANTEEAYRHYIDEYPQGIHYTEAETGIKEIEAIKKKVTPEVSDKMVSEPVKGSVTKTDSKKLLVIGIAVVVLGGILWFILKTGSGNKSDKTETVAWNMAVQKNDSAAFAGYINEFPRGSFISQAKQKLDSISKINAANLLSENKQQVTIDKNSNDSNERLRAKRLNDSLIGLAINKVKNDTAAMFNVGQKYGGGTIFYIDNSGKHGLIVAPENIYHNIYTYPDREPGVLFWNDAKEKCDALKLNGFTDWRMPSKDELLKLSIASGKSSKRYVPDGHYWSSTKKSTESAYAVAINKGFKAVETSQTINTGGGGDILVCRPVRSF